MGKLGTYDIEWELGRGSMGVVYLAHDPRLQRRVALKTIHVPQGLDRDEIAAFRERFLREAQAAGGISHPGIVTIYGVDECAEEVLPFIAMEYVAGPNLREILKKEGRLDPKHAFRIADALADALHTAHSAGVIHRDIKPANVLVRESDGAVKIADFGVAHLTLNELTRSGEMVGSPAYMAPEQIRSGDADERSDLFSLGVILYEMLAGERPFAGTDMAAIIHQVVYQDVLPITQRVDGLPRVLNAFFDRALAKSPRDRFQTGAQFREALNDVQLEYLIERSGGLELGPESTFTPVTPVDVEAPDRHNLRQYLVFGAMFALFLVGWVFMNRSPDSPQPMQISPPDLSRDLFGSPDKTAPPTDAASATPGDPLLGESAIPPEVPVAASGKPAPPPKSALKPAATSSKTKPAPVKAPVVEVTEVAETATTVDPDAADGSGASGSGEPGATAGGELDAVVSEYAQLTLVTRSALKAGTLTLFVDGQETLTLDLASGGNTFTRFSKKAVNRGTVNEAGVLDLLPGPHEILVRVVRPGKELEHEATITVDLAAGDARNLKIAVGRLFGSELALRLE